MDLVGISLVGCSDSITVERETSDMEGVGKTLEYN